MKSHSFSKRAGQNTVEYLMMLAVIVGVILVVGILSAMAIPSFLRSQGESQLDGSSGKLAGAIQWARMQATKSGMRAYVVMDSTSGRWSIWLDRNGNLALDTTSDSLLSRDSLGVSVRFGMSFTPPTPLSVMGPSTPATGFGAISSSSTVDDCVDGQAFPYLSGGPATWAWSGKKGKIVACGGATADLSQGALYLSSTRSTSKAYAIVFNHSTSGQESFSLRRYKWTSGGAWTRQ